MTGQENHDPGRTANPDPCAPARPARRNTHPLIEPDIVELLRLVREHLEMDVLLVLQDDTGAGLPTAPAPRRTVEQEASQALAVRLSRLVAAGQLPALTSDVPALARTHALPDTALPLSAYMIAPVLLQDGSHYGWLCCLCFDPRQAPGEREFRRLEMSARLAARRVDEAYGRSDDPSA